ncbi:MAG: YceI family protein [Pseudomonas sp.]|uniref:YceI family protein n=1 Tax=Pseudomonas sp. TaxID=306 RepID=UPI0030F0F42B
MLKSLVFFLAALALPAAHANWYLDNESSRLSFISTKGGKLSEVHRFLTLHGQIDDNGAANLRIELDSASTGIPLRDERLRTLLFDTEHFAEALVKANIDLAPITTLAPGAQLELRLPLTVELHGQQQSYSAELLVTRLDEQRFQVVTLAPLVLQVEDFDLSDGLEALRKLAGVSTISWSVPVGAVLIFTSR